MSKGINFTPFLPAESTLQPEGLLHTRSSEEYWTMGATLIQPCRVSEEGLRVVKLFQM